VGAIIGTITGIGGLLLSAITLRRDRGALQLALHFFSEHSHVFVVTYFPGAVLHGNPSDEKIADYVVVTAFNRGNRPIHLEKLELEYVEPSGPGSSRTVIPFDHVLTEEKRRVSFIFENRREKPFNFLGVGVIDDLHRRHRVYAPTWTRSKRLGWYIKRAVALRRQRRNNESVPKDPAA
jgi:hypothetical protein